MYIIHGVGLPYSIPKIISDGYLRPGSIGCDIYSNKVFSRIYSDIKKARYSQVAGCAIVLQNKILKYKYYIMTYGGFGNADTSIYISPYLFKIIKFVNFNRDRFVELIKLIIDDKTALKCLICDSAALFKSKVVKNRVNPPLSSIINKRSKNFKINNINVNYYGNICLDTFISKIIFSRYRGTEDRKTKVEDTELNGYVDSVKNKWDYEIIDWFI